MTIAEYLKDIEKMPTFTGKDGATLKDSLIKSTSIWDNSACKGYCLTAAQSAGFSPEQTKELLKQLSQTFNDITVAEAAELYEKY
jgi:hypothetical protein